MLRRLAWIAVVLWGGVLAAGASGPRYVTGPPFFTGTAGQPIGWRQQNLLYFTDPGDLGPNVNHASADALVAAAAATWNVPVANITLGHGGVLAEHASGQNVYLSSDGLMWPADVDRTNAAAVPVAVIYDTDGSVTDNLLGAGASDPRGCSQTAVTETVDAFDPAGYILHAVVVLNGRCTGAAPEAQLELQYQLERAFGRVLGLAWSQVNDNVFTGVPAATYDQALHWPIMHPIEIVCGAYTYQCLPLPFQLRPDDLAGLVGLYPVAAGVMPPAGKSVSLALANQVSGTVSFPSGEGMEGVNVLVRRQNTFTSRPQAWFETAAVSGSLFRRSPSSPFVSSPQDAETSMGTNTISSQGFYTMPYVEVIDQYGAQTEVISTESVNPLYARSFSLGPYRAGGVSPSGTTPTPFSQPGVAPGRSISVNFVIADASPTCGDGLDGTAAAPVAAPGTGWWNGLICGLGHASYAALNVQPGRSLTVEVTALDANGFQTTNKAMPVIGLFQASDAPGSLPSLGVTPGAFQSLSQGMTTLTATPFPTGSAGGVVRIGIADQRGDGRPDFRYQARLFYADMVAPAEIAPSTSSAVVLGMGFRVGNEVRVNGVVARVTDCTSTAITFAIPAMATAAATAGSSVDVQVTDLGTGATTVIAGALTFVASAKSPGSPAVMRLVSAPSATLPAGETAPQAFAVQMLAEDGVTPVAGTTVVFSGANVTFSACGQSTCSVVTDASGVASTNLAARAAGNVTLLATDGQLTRSASLMAVTDAVAMRIQQAPEGSVLAGRLASTVFQVQVVSALGAGVAGHLVTFTVSGTGGAVLTGCNQATCGMTTNIYGQAQVGVLATSAGVIVVEAVDGALRQQVSLTVIANPNVMTLLQVPAATSSLGSSAGNLSVRLTQADQTTPVAKVPVTLTAPPGVIFTQCASNVCVLDTDNTGTTGSGVQSGALGSFTLTAAYGSVSASTSMTVTPSAQLVVTILTAPSGDVPVGLFAPIAFSAKVLDGSGRPIRGAAVAIGGPLDAVVMGCGVASCIVSTDSNGIVSETVKPIRPGSIALEVVYLNVIGSASFNATGPGETFTVTAAPPATATVGDVLKFSLLGLSPGGMIPLASHPVWVNLISGNAAIANCQLGLCKLYTDANGRLTITATLSSPGEVAIAATLDGIVQTASVLVAPRTYILQTISEPSGSFMMSAPVTPSFAVKLLAADGATPVAGQNVTFSLSAGSVSIAACRALPCVVVTNASGLASTGAIASSVPGTVTLRADQNSLSATTSFRVLSNVDLVTLASAPVSVYEGATTSAPLAVKVTLSDGSTPVANVAVVLSGGWFTACAAQSCALRTDANGMVASSVAGVAAGRLLLVATVQLATGNQVVSTPLEVLANFRSMTPVTQRTYLAESAVVLLPLTAAAVQNGSAAAGLPVSWTSGIGLRVGGAVTGLKTDGEGRINALATAGPLAAGAQAGASACAWTSVCAGFSVVSVPAATWQLAVTEGGGQAASRGGTLRPLTAQVTDAAGHLIAGATISVGQTVTARDVDCPTLGRCPAAPVLLTGRSTLVSDLNGNVSVAPLTVPGVPTLTAIAFSSGTQGFATAVVSSSP